MGDGNSKRTRFARIRSWFKKLLPRSALEFVKRWYYPRLLRRIDDTTEADFPAIRRILRPGDVVVDIGANIGTTTAFLHQCVRPQGRIYAFEPVASTYALLENGIRALGLGNVTPFNLALSDRAGVVELEIPHYEDGTENYYEARITGSPGRSANNLRTLSARASTADDELLDTLDSLAFMKIDVEGHELPCVRGALGIIRKFRPALMIEIGGDLADAPSHAGQLRTLLESEGYACFVFSAPTLQPWSDGRTVVNYFFLQPGQASSMGAGVPDQTDQFT